MGPTITILNEQLEPVGIVDTFESLIWTDRYNEYGDFEIHIPVNEASIEVLKSDYYVANEDSEHGMIIESVLISSDVEKGNYITVSGRSLESVLERRIVWSRKKFSGKLQNIIQVILMENIGAYASESRRIEGFVVEMSDDPKITNLEIDIQLMGENLYDLISSLCKEHNIGFKVTFNKNNEMVFKLYSGIDRSFSQNENPFVVFSPDFDNIINTNYAESTKDLKNVALVMGDGEYPYQVSTTVGLERGLNRREIFIDASDTPREIDGEELTEMEYVSQLTQKGKTELAQYKETVAFEGEIEATRMFKYGEDFFLGDIVQMANEYGHEGRVYISEYVVNQNESGISMYPTFKYI